MECRRKEPVEVLIETDLRSCAGRAEAGTPASRLCLRPACPSFAARRSDHHEDTKIPGPPVSLCVLRVLSESWRGHFTSRRPDRQPRCSVNFIASSIDPDDAGGLVDSAVAAQNPPPAPGARRSCAAWSGAVAPAVLASPGPPPVDSPLHRQPLRDRRNRGTEPHHEVISTVATSKPGPNEDGAHIDVAVSWWTSGPDSQAQPEPGRAAVRLS